MADTHNLNYTFEEIDNLLAKTDELYTKTVLDSLLGNKLNTSDVESELSETSENPVQNKTIYAALQALNARIAALEDT